MFKSVGWTWNPLAGCSHGCKYCYAAQLMKRWGKDFTPKFRPSFLKDKMPEDNSWIFVGSMGDTFCKGMKDEWIEELLTFIENYNGNNKFLLQTKNPRRLNRMRGRLDKLRTKVILGTTLETTEETPWSSAPSTFARVVNLGYMKEYEGHKTFLSLEPLSDFKLSTMIGWIESIHPEAVEIGLENYTTHTIKPPNWKIAGLIQFLKDSNIEYVLKENLDYLQPESKTDEDNE